MRFCAGVVKRFVFKFLRLERVAGSLKREPDALERVTGSIEREPDALK